MAHKFQKPWAVLMVLGSMVYEGVAAGVFARSCNSVCAISMDHWHTDPRPSFCSLHPCAPVPENPPLLEAHTPQAVHVITDSARGWQVCTT